MRTSGPFIFFTAWVAFCSCTAHRPGMGEPATATAPASRSADPIAFVSLEQIQPRPELGQPAPATRSSVAPLEAVELYAKARDALLQNQRYTAIILLEKALQIDPESFELNRALGKAYQGIGGAGDRAIAAFLRAAQINPNDLEVQTELGRAYQARGDLTSAIRHFRLAMQTDEYRNSQALSAVVDYRLAVALQQRGYLTAAVECYRKLLHRLEHPTLSSRTTPEIGYLIARPELVYEQIGQLSEQKGDLPAALEAYQTVAQRMPGDFDVQARVVSILMKLGRHAQALSVATELVRQFHASSESIKLLRDAYQGLGRQNDFVDALKRLHRQQPDDRSILFALADALDSTGQHQQACQLLSEAMERQSDTRIVRRLFDLYSRSNQTSEAARLIVIFSATHPQATSELATLMERLARWSQDRPLRLSDLQRIEVPVHAQAAKQYWIWKMASDQSWSRPLLARAALEQAAGADVPFDPACRAMLQSILERTDWDQTRKQQAAEDLIDSVRRRGRPDLAEELSGLRALHFEQVDQAVQRLSEAIRLAGRPSIDLQIEYALALLRQGNAARFEQLMWRLIGNPDASGFDDVYQLLISYYRQNNAQARAWSVTEAWVANDPNNLHARLQQIEDWAAQRQGEQALAAVSRLFAQHPQDMDVAARMVFLYNAAGQSQRAIDLLEEELAWKPTNRAAAQILVEIYAGTGRLADASRVADFASAAAAGNPDLLYFVAGLYQRIDQPQSAERLLGEILRIDPAHPQAGNDLGYLWADAGKNLDRAEQLIRQAVEAEPDNPSYLDSLGWVLYKRGQFEQACQLLQQAADPPQQADPVILDHLGDALWRLNRTEQAKLAWQQTLQRLDQVPPRQELKNLRLGVQSKLRQAENNQPVNVAPVVESPPGSQQAKN